MVFKRLQDSQDGLYLQAMQLYQSSFPLHEQRKPDAQRAILKEPDYQFNLLMEEDHLMGELLCWETQEFIYVEHLCILPQLRDSTAAVGRWSCLNKEESRSFWKSTHPSTTSPCAGKDFMNEPVIRKIRLHTSIRRIGRALQGIRWW